MRRSLYESIKAAILELDDPDLAGQVADTLRLLGTAAANHSVALHGTIAPEKHRIWRDVALVDAETFVVEDPEPEPETREAFVVVEYTDYELGHVRGVHGTLDAARAALPTGLVEQPILGCDPVGLVGDFRDPSDVGGWHVYRFCYGVEVIR